jgi:hypothetical protein
LHWLTITRIGLDGPTFTIAAVSVTVTTGPDEAARTAAFKPRLTDPDPPPKFYELRDNLEVSAEGEELHVVRWTTCLRLDAKRWRPKRLGAKDSDSATSR